MHIMKTPGIWSILANIFGLIKVTGIIIGIRGGDAVPPRVSRGRSSSAGELPLRFCRQDISPALRKIRCFLIIQTG